MTEVSSSFRKDVAAITDADVLRLASSSDPGEAAFGRLLATGVAPIVQAFVNAEMRRGTHPVHVNAALVNLVASSVASIICHRAGDRTSAADYEVLRFEAFLKHSIENAGASHHGGAQ